MAINTSSPVWACSAAAVSIFGAMGRLAGQKGARSSPARGGDLPIEDAPDYAIVFNLKRAKDLGIEISPRVLSRANRHLQG